MIFADTKSVTQKLHLGLSLELQAAFNGFNLRLDSVPNSVAVSSVALDLRLD